MRYQGRHTAAAIHGQDPRGEWPRVPGRLGTAAVVIGTAVMGLAIAPAMTWPPAFLRAAPAIPLPHAPPAPTLIESTSELQVANPARLILDDIEVDAPVVPLGLRKDGSLAVPDDFDAVGWYSDGPEPGEVGPAVIIGHVDSYTGPAVFARLDDLQPGDEVTVKAVNGSSVSFVVDRVEQHPKDRFPTEAVYGSTGEPALRLITCGGPFDRAADSYRDNVVVFARIATPWRPATDYSST